MPTDDLDEELLEEHEEMPEDLDEEDLDDLETISSASKTTPRPRGRRRH